MKAEIGKEKENITINWSLRIKKIGEVFY